MNYSLHVQSVLSICVKCGILYEPWIWKGQDKINRPVLVCKKCWKE